MINFQKIKKKYFFCYLESVGRVSPPPFFKIFTSIQNPLKIANFHAKIQWYFYDFQILLQITESSECGSDPVWIWMQELIDEIIEEKL